jgi:hypothetical protein
MNMNTHCTTFKILRTNRKKNKVMNVSTQSINGLCIHRTKKNHLLFDASSCHLSLVSQ